MDGPKVNWKFYNDLEKDIHSNHDVKLLNVGSCGLHKVHGCFKTAFEQSGWQMDSIYLVPLLCLQDITRKT